MGQKRDEYTEKLKDQLDEWNTKIDRLEQNAKETKAEAEELINDRIAGLRAKRDHLEARFKDLQTAGQDAWEKMKDGIAKAELDLITAFDDARKRFSKETAEANRS